MMKKLYIMARDLLIHKECIEEFIDELKEVSDFGKHNISKKEDIVKRLDNILEHYGELIKGGYHYDN